LGVTKVSNKNTVGMMVSNSAPKYQLAHCRPLGLAFCTGMIVPPRFVAERLGIYPEPPQSRA
jgi:hypothetical protein